MMGRWPAFLYRDTRLCLYDFIFPGEIPPVEARVPLRLATIGAGSPELELIASVQGRRRVERRLGRRELCFAALHRERVISYIWLSQATVGIEEVDLSIEVQPDEAYLYNAFTLEAWRGRNLYPAVLRGTLEYCQKRGLSRALIFVAEDNHPSRRGVVKAGFTLFQTITCHRVLGRSWHSYGPRLEAHPPVRLVG
ncbi:MAG: GNAT family N-acetyltransferase [Nitrospinota bacterium]